ncbi:large ribosomal subunit protein eL31-like [Neofelis nebulosa]|uniref:large ribosomal subunit protein eL31-like n=1 Tax=Neofelis nebulosa TaxID=61452 RepID=UPI002729D77E|nr:large ribosomal subunit protein eL31-like [Neofelis nebulosa]
MSITAPTKQGGEKEGHSAINEAVTRKHTINFHKGIHAVGFRKSAPQALKKIQKFAMKEMGTPELPDVCTDIRLNEAVWAKGARKGPCRNLAGWSRKCNKHEGSPNKLCTFFTYVPITTFQNVQLMWGQGWRKKGVGELGSAGSGSDTVGLDEDALTGISQQARR